MSIPRLLIAAYLSLVCVFAHAATELPIDAAYAPPANIVKIYRDTNDVVYFLAGDRTRIYRWSLAEAQFLAPIEVPDRPAHIAHSPHTNRLYLAGFPSAPNQVKYIDLDSPGAAVFFRWGYGDVCGLEFTSHSLFVCANAQGDYRRTSVLYSEDVGFLDDTAIYLLDGVKDIARSSDGTQLFIAAHSTDTAYLTRIPLAADGSEFLWWTGQRRTADADNFRAPLRVLARDKFLLTGEGRVLDTQDLNVEHASLLPAGEVLSDAVWWAESISTLRALNGDALVERWDLRFALHNSELIAGAPIAMFEHDGAFTVFTDSGHGLRAWRHTPPLVDTDNDQVIDAADEFPLDPNYWSVERAFPASPDTDRDGIADTEDQYPQDPFAAFDTDADGVPDSTDEDDDNDGVADSEDAQPLVAGQTVVFANEDQYYRPKTAVADGALYVVPAGTRELYRLPLDGSEAATMTLLPSAPTAITDSPDGNTLFIGYADGAITRIHFPDGTQEQPWAQVPNAACALAVADTRLFATSCQSPDSSYDADYSMFGADGELLNTYDGTYAPGFVWNSALSRLYFVQAHVSPRSLQYIDFANGRFEHYWSHEWWNLDSDGLWLSERGDKLYGGTRVFAASTAHPYNVYIENPSRDAVWWNENLIRIADTQQLDFDTRSLVTHLDAAYRVHRSFHVDGAPLRVIRRGDEMLIATVVRDGSVKLTRYQPTVLDTDGDNVVDYADKYPTDASRWHATLGFPGGLDSDRDGIDDLHDVEPFDRHESFDFDGDGAGDNADLDDDNDGANDLVDAAPYDAAITFDNDGDGTGNEVDNCRNRYNSAQWDSDRDGIGNACDGNFFPTGVNTLPAAFTEYFNLSGNRRYVFDHAPASWAKTLTGTQPLTDEAVGEMLRMRNGSLVMDGFSGSEFSPDVMSSIGVEARFAAPAVLLPAGARIGTVIRGSGTGTADFRSLDVTLFPSEVNYTFTVRLLGLEDVTVNHGRFRALRIRYTFSANTDAMSWSSSIHLRWSKDVELWLVRGVGLVKYENLAGRTVTTRDIHNLFDTNFTVRDPGPVAAAGPVLARPSAAPRLLTPSNRTYLLKAAYVFKWTRVPRATKYQLVLKGPNGRVVTKWLTSTALGCAASGTTCAARIANTVGVGTWNWNVRPANSAGSGPRSATVQFRVRRG